MESVHQQHIWGTVIDFSAPAELKILLRVCKDMFKLVFSSHSVTEKLVYEFPVGGKMKALTPKKVVVYTTDSVPVSATHVIICSFWENPIYSPLPPTLTHIHFGNFFNSSVDNILPSCVSNITFGYYFNTPISKYPDSLTSLIFGNRFNHPIINLPLSLTRLIFGNDFDNTIEYFPPSLLELQFGHCFNQTISEFPNLVKLVFGYSFSRYILSYPSSLKELYFGHLYNNPINAGDLPSSLTNLVFGSSFNQPLNNLPNSLKYLSFQKYYMGNISFNQPLDNLPSLTQLYIPSSFNQSFDCLPQSITKLIIAKCPPEISHLPQSLTHLEITNYSGENIYFPPSLTHLTLTSKVFMGEYYSLENLPSSLIYLSPGLRYDLSFHSLPSTLQTLIIHSHKDIFEIISLPVSLRHLEFCSYLFLRCTIPYLPHLTHLYFHNIVLCVPLPDFPSLTDLKINNFIKTFNPFPHLPNLKNFNIPLKLKAELWSLDPKTKQKIKVK